MILCAGISFAKMAKRDKNVLENEIFRTEQIYISQTNVPLSQAIGQFKNAYDWKAFTMANADGYIYIDPRSGKPTSITTVFPLIPGIGTNNTITKETLSKTLGYQVDQITEREVRDVVIKFLGRYAYLWNLNMNEIGNIRITNPVDYLWQVYITRQINGIPVRDAHIALTINHGNLVVMGFQKWGKVTINLIPAISKEQAVESGLKFIADKLSGSGQASSGYFEEMIAEPHLEVIPTSIDTSVMGQGYGHSLVWTYTFRVAGFTNTWEILVDAQSNKLLSFQDLNRYVTKKFIGSTYTRTNDDCCPEGCAIPSTPIPYISTGFAAPNDFTNLAGLYDYTSGTATTNLTGRYVTVTDNCGAISEMSTTGDIDFAGTTGEHDCIAPAGHSLGDTASARLGANEITQVNRIVRSWINYAWLDSTAVSVDMNIKKTCNAWYSNNALHMYRSGGGCRNTGEESASLDHEWGHGLDDNDANGVFSSPEEVYADLVSIIRLHASCPDRGWWWTLDVGCGSWTCPGNPSSTGFKCDGYGDCCTTCTGLRELDWAGHVSGAPHTPANFNCVYCGTGTGPCGAETHCENAPGAEAGWDLAARDLQAAPFNYDRQTAFELTSRSLFVGSGNVADWYSCNCGSGTSNGCAVTNGYMQWLSSDDDDGNLNNGTPHMSAFYAAFNRHALACATPTVQNSGCSGGPAAAPTLTGFASDNTVYLSWTTVAGASQYWIFRTDGVGCDFGKEKIATVTGTSYTDTVLFNGRTFNYQILPVGSNTVCVGRLSNCLSITPAPCTSCAKYQTGTAVVTQSTGGDGDTYMDNCETGTIRVTLQNIGTGIAQNTQVTVTTSNPFVTITTPMPINAGNIPVSGTVNATFNANIGQGASQAACKQVGTFNISVQAQGQTGAIPDSFNFTYEVDQQVGDKTWAFEPATGLEDWIVNSGTWALNSTRVNPGGSTRSLHSSQALNDQCDILFSPVVQINPSAPSSTLTIPNWYAIENKTQNKWNDRAHVHIIDIDAGGTRTLISPSSGKLYETGNYNASTACGNVDNEAGFASDTTGNFWGNSAFNLNSFIGRNIQIEIKYFTNATTALEGIYVDDINLTNAIIQNCDAFSNTCGAACTAPTFGGVQTVTDVSACVNNGIQVTWNQPSSWGQGATSGTYSVRRYTAAGCSGGYTTVASGLTASTTSFTDTTATASTTYYYQVVATNNCTSPLSSTGTNSCSSSVSDVNDTTPCPNVGNTGLISKSGINASIAWTAVACADITGYRVYGSTAYDASFPSAWTLLGTVAATNFTDPLTSSYIAYKMVSVDVCGNASSY